MTQTNIVDYVINQLFCSVLSTIKSVNIFTITPVHYLFRQFVFSNELSNNSRMERFYKHKLFCSIQKQTTVKLWKPINRLFCNTFYLVYV